MDFSWGYWPNYQILPRQENLYYEQSPNWHYNEKYYQNNFEYEHIKTQNRKNTLRRTRYNMHQQHNLQIAMVELAQLNTQWRPIENYIQKPNFQFSSYTDPLFVFKNKNYVKKCERNLNFIHECLIMINMDDFLREDFDVAMDFQTRPVNQLDTEFNFNALISKFSIGFIEKVRNPYLAIQYQLKKMQYKKENVAVKEMFLFHGTKYPYLRDICSNNFNWRLFGLSRGFKFGQGVSFTPDFYYASHYGEVAYRSVSILAKVLVNTHSIGKPSTVVPPNKCDTTTNENCSVYVKYDDNSFYPSYIIYYRNM